MKKILFCLIIFSNISCKKNDEKSNNQVVLHDSIIQDFNKSNIKITNLPFGYKKIYEDYYNKELNKQELYEFESSPNLIDFYDSISTNNKLISNYKFLTKNAYDFDLVFYKNINSLKTDQDSYNMAIRLPDANRNRIFIANSTKNDKKYGYNLINNIDLVIKDTKGNIISSLNLSHQYFPSDTDNTRYFIGAIFKYFYIDNNYIIHIKYFDMFEEYSTEMIAYIKYKITDNGDIIRYFDRETGHYKSEIEEGEIKNHTKEGIWRENTSSVQSTYYMKKYSKGILIDNIEVVTEDESGIKTSVFIDKDTYLPIKKIK